MVLLNLPGFFCPRLRCRATGKCAINFPHSCTYLVFTHLDHRIPFVRQRARSMLFQLLRSWTPGYAELHDRSTGRSRSSVKEAIATLEKEAEDEEDDLSDAAVPKMKQLASRILSFLDPLAPHLVSQWGSLALEWGTSCSIRATAFRSSVPSCILPCLSDVFPIPSPLQRKISSPSYPGSS